MSTLKNSLPAILIVILLGIVAVAAASNFAFNNNASVSMINITGYLYANSTGLLTDLDWDPISTGENDTRVIYVNSTSTIPAILNLTTADWIPTNAADNVSLTWNREDTVIQPNTMINATLTLAVATDVGDLSTFTFTTIINAEEEP